jgi:hypothetical protein
MAVRFPSLDFFRALQERTRVDRARFEKLGYCDTTFGVRIGSELYALAFEVYECTKVEPGEGSAKLDFVLSGSPETWREMTESIVKNEGAGAGHTLNTLSHVGDRMKVEYDDPEGADRFYRFMASIQEFFDQAHHLDIRYE